MYYRRNANNHFWVISTLIVIITAVLIAKTAKSQGSFEVISLGVEVSDGQPLNTYMVICTPNDNNAVITVQITFNGGATEHRSGLYCGVKFYVSGSVSTVEVMYASSSPSAPEHSHKVWLPLLANGDDVQDKPEDSSTGDEPAFR